MTSSVSSEAVLGKLHFRLGLRHNVIIWLNIFKVTKTKNLFLVTFQVKMEVAVAEEKKKIFRARKTMKISDRQQLETLHSTLLSSGATLSNPSPPPMQNGRHKEDGHKALDKERHDTSDSQAMSPTSPGSCGSPTPSLSLNLSPSPPICEATTFPTSPFRSLNFDLGKSADGVMEGSPSNGSSAAAPTQPKAGNDAKAAKMDTITENKKVIYLSKVADSGIFILILLARPLAECGIFSGRYKRVSQQTPSS